MAFESTVIYLTLLDVWNAPLPLSKQILTSNIVAPKISDLCFKLASVGNVTPKLSMSVKACFIHPFHCQVIAPTSTPPAFEIWCT